VAARRWFANLGWWVAVGALCAACGAAGVYHRVRPGQTLSEIGAAYGISDKELARANKIRDPARIYAGDRLWIPGAEHEIDVPVRRRPTPRPALRDERRTLSRVRPPGAPPFRWPLENGVVSSAFGRRWGKYHDGIDIAAPVGSAVRAAAAGRVVFDRSLSGYGKVIIIFHGNGFSTVYAHNNQHYVRRGQKVRAGQRIAAVGRSGRTTGPNLHFEVRHENVAHDPMLFLPARGRAAVSIGSATP